MNYPYQVNNTVTYNTGYIIWVAVAFVLAIIGGLTFYFFFLKNDKKVDNKSLAWLKEFFNFKKMLIEDLLKISYVVLTIFITLYSFALIGDNFFAFLLVLLVGNLILRLCFEGALLTIMIWKNTSDINKKMKK